MDTPSNECVWIFLPYPLQTGANSQEISMDTIDKEWQYCHTERTGMAPSPLTPWCHWLNNTNNTERAVLEKWKHPREKIARLQSGRPDNQVCCYYYTSSQLLLTIPLLKVTAIIFIIICDFLLLLLTISSLWNAISNKHSFVLFQRDFCITGAGVRTTLYLFNLKFLNT